MTGSGVRAVATGAAVAVLLVGCGGGGKEGGDRPAEATATPSASRAAAAPGALEFSIDNAATGPAPAVPGAVAGGTVNVLELDDVAHLDPARIYVSYYHTSRT